MTLSYSLKGAASATGLSQTHLSDAIKAGALRAKRSGGLNESDEPVGKYLILARDLETYLDGLVDA